MDNASFRRQSGMSPPPVVAGADKRGHPEYPPACAGSTTALVDILDVPFAVLLEN
jgi:hypothetical protein